MKPRSMGLCGVGILVMSFIALAAAVHGGENANETEQSRKDAFAPGRLPVDAARRAESLEVAELRAEVWKLAKRVRELEAELELLKVERPIPARLLRAVQALGAPYSSAVPSRELPRGAVEGGRTNGMPFYIIPCMNSKTVPAASNRVDGVPSF